MCLQSSCFLPSPLSPRAPLPAPHTLPEGPAALSHTPDPNKKYSYLVSTYYVLGNVLALSIYHLLDSSQQPSNGGAIKFLFYEGEQIHHRIPSVQQVSIRAGVARGWGGWPPMVSPACIWNPRSLFIKVSVSQAFEWQEVTGSEGAVT